MLLFVLNSRSYQCKSFSEIKSLCVENTRFYPREPFFSYQNSVLFTYVPNVVM